MTPGKLLRLIGADTLKREKYISIGSRSIVPTVAAVLFVGIGLAGGQSVQPAVAIHDSELTRALESMPAVAPTPTGPGTTGKQWWPTDWHYFVMPESVKEALRSDGTAFSVV
ncbi:MAG TPA: hypothetical protein VNM37_00810, partial [Candidatus Dormibacteraeota bacterium]|nr:hypothetical protein [Candidatus Dormibacteraeota bacterium]